MIAKRLNHPRIPAFWYVLQESCFGIIRVLSKGGMVIVDALGPKGVVQTPGLIYKIYSHTDKLSDMKPIVIRAILQKVSSSRELKDNQAYEPVRWFRSLA